MKKLKNLIMFDKGCHILLGKDSICLSVLETQAVLKLLLYGREKQI